MTATLKDVLAIVRDALLVLVLLGVLTLGAVGVYKFGELRGQLQQWQEGTSPAVSVEDPCGGTVC